MAAQPISIGHFIHGRLQAGTSGRASDVYNPATGQVSARVDLASRAEVDAAVAAARAAFPAWAGTSPLRRARVRANEGPRRWTLIRFVRSWCVRRAQAVRINELTQAFPQVSRASIEADLRRTRNVDVTVENLIHGRVQVRRRRRQGSCTRMAWV